MAPSLGPEAERVDRLLQVGTGAAQGLRGGFEIGRGGFQRGQGFGGNRESRLRELASTVGFSGVMG